MGMTRRFAALSLVPLFLSAPGCGDCPSCRDEGSDAVDVADVTDMAEDSAGFVDEGVFGLDSFDDSEFPDATDLCFEHSECSWHFRCVDSRCVEKPTCEVREVPEGCSAGLDEQDCAAEGGIWSCDPCPGVNDCRCACPAADAGCPCWSEFHCDGDCIFTGEQDMILEICLGIGHCSDYAVRWDTGCMCLPDDYPVSMVCSC